MRQANRRKPQITKQSIKTNIENVCEYAKRNEVGKAPCINTKNGLRIFRIQEIGKTYNLGKCSKHIKGVVRTLLYNPSHNFRIHFA